MPAKTITQETGSDFHTLYPVDWHDNIGACEQTAASPETACSAFKQEAPIAGKDPDHSSQRADDKQSENGHQRTQHLHLCAETVPFDSQIVDPCLPQIGIPDFEVE